MNTIEALLAERSGYLRRGLTNRVAQVDEALAALGVAVESASLEHEVETTARKRTIKRKKG